MSIAWILNVEGFNHINSSATMWKDVKSLQMILAMFSTKIGQKGGEIHSLFCGRLKD